MEIIFDQFYRKISLAHSIGQPNLAEQSRSIPKEDIRHRCISIFDLYVRVWVCFCLNGCEEHPQDEKNNNKPLFLATNKKQQQKMWISSKRTRKQSINKMDRTTAAKLLFIHNMNITCSVLCIHNRVLVDTKTTKKWWFRSRILVSHIGYICVFCVSSLFAFLCLYIFHYCRNQTVWIQVAHTLAGTNKHNVCTLLCMCMCACVV